MPQPTTTRRRSSAPAPTSGAGSAALAKGKDSSTGVKEPQGAPPATFNWRNIGMILAPIVLLWVLAVYSGSRAFLIVMAVLTVVIVGFLGYALRWASKQRKLMELLQSASVSPEARKEALAKLESGSGNKDVMNLIAKAQLQAQDDPQAALATLESVDLAKVPGTLADEVRASRAQLYLMSDRVKEARELADDIKIKDAQNAESRGVLAAIVSEAWARTGKHTEALDLLRTIRPEDPDFAKVRVPLMFARIFASFAAGQKDAVRRDLQLLLKENMDYLGRFVNPKAKVHPELQKITRDILSRDPEVRRMAQKQQRGQRRMR